MKTNPLTARQSSASLWRCRANTRQRRRYLKTAAATLWRGPPLLAKAKKRVGDAESFA